MSKATKIIIAILIIAFGGLIFWSIGQSNKDSVDFSKYDAGKIIEASADNGNIGDHVRGKVDSEIIFVEYTDFQCSGCASLQGKVNTLFDEYGDRIAFVSRSFPIVSIHQNARAAASAAESAGLQGYYYEMTDALFSNQSVWFYSTGQERNGIFTDLFQQLAPEGDVEKFKSDMGNAGVLKKIDFDYNLGTKNSKVTATPSIYLNGEYVDFTSATNNTEFYNIVHAKIDEKLKEKGLPTGPANSEDDSDQEESE